MFVPALFIVYRYKQFTLTMESVKFYRGEYNNYVSDTMKDGIYFATDKQIIIMNGIEYGGGETKQIYVDGETLVIK